MKFEVAKVFNQRWCQCHDGGEDFAAAHTFLREHVEATAPQESFLNKAGSTKGTRVTDVAVATQILIEAGSDSRSSLGITSSDIASFFDTVPPSRLAKYLAARLGDPWRARK